MNDDTRRLFPAAVAVLAICFLVLMMKAELPDASKGGFDLRRFAALPVSADGRVKPIDTYARTSLMLISGRQTFRVEDPETHEPGPAQPAVRWLLDALVRPDEARAYKVFRIDHPDVLAIFGKTHEDGTRFDYNLLISKKDEFLKQITLVQKVAPNQRNDYQRAVLDLFNKLMRFGQISSYETPFVIPPMQPGDEWQSMLSAYDKFKAGEPNAAAGSFQSMIQAYGDNKPDDFNRELDVFESMCNKAAPNDAPRARWEVFFNNWAPFYQAMILYVVAFLLACVGLLIRGSASPTDAQKTGAKERTWADTLTSAAAWLVLLTFIAHTAGLVFRIYLQGRPPVTNLYSSAVFIGWACVLLCLFLERVHKIGLGSIAATTIGFTTLIIAHQLGETGDTLEMMRAVLDSNFWLSTHVVAVTLGYSATFLAGFFAILYILLGVFTRVLTPDIAKTFAKMVYGVVAFALLLSFVGTVLGGIWADQSWGRFWGWDPKENGAVLIVLMNALILHARWAGLIKDRGLMALAVTGNIVTSWSWFGTNMLGVGLHAYGFIEAAVACMAMFVGSQLIIIGIALLPDRYWRSKNQKNPGLKASA
jgi:ABC-type transport system involved in cytochrome c biogenesis permease subunit